MADTYDEPPPRNKMEVFWQWLVSDEIEGFCMGRLIGSIDVRGCPRRVRHVEGVAMAHVGGKEVEHLLVLVAAEEDTLDAVFLMMSW